MKTKLVFILMLMLALSLNITARYYNPDTGRFISADSATPGGGADLQGLNRYSYCDNNPVKYVDPTGHYQQISTVARNADKIARVVNAMVYQSPSVAKTVSKALPFLGPVSSALASTSAAALGVLVPSNLFEKSQYDETPKSLITSSPSTQPKGKPQDSTSTRDTTTNHSIAYLPGGMGFGVPGVGSQEKAIETARNFALKFDTVKIVDDLSVLQDNGDPEFHKDLISAFLQEANNSRIIAIEADWVQYAKTITNSNSGIYYVAPQCYDWILAADKNLSVRPEYGQKVYSDLPFNGLPSEGWSPKKQTVEQVKSEGVQSEYFDSHDVINTYSKK